MGDVQLHAHEWEACGEGGRNVVLRYRGEQPTLVRAAASPHAMRSCATRAVVLRSSVLCRSATCCACPRRPQWTLCHAATPPWSASCGATCRPTRARRTTSSATGRTSRTSSRRCWASATPPPARLCRCLPPSCARLRQRSPAAALSRLPAHQPAALVCCCLTTASSARRLLLWHTAASAPRPCWRLRSSPSAASCRKRQRCTTAAPSGTSAASPCTST